MSLSSEPAQAEVVQPVATTEQSVNNVALSGTERDWKKWKYSAVVSAVAVPTLLAIGSSLQSNDGNSHLATKGAQPAAAKAKLSESASPEQETESMSEKPVAVQTTVDTKTEMTPEQCKEMAEKQWKAAQVSSTCVSIENSLMEMDKTLEGADCTREDIGATPEAIQQNYVRLAKEEWERANVLSIPLFRVGALTEMQSALGKAGVGIEAINVTAEMLEELQSRSSTASSGKARE